MRQAHTEDRQDRAARQTRIADKLIRPMRLIRRETVAARSGNNEISRCSRSLRRPQIFLTAKASEIKYSINSLTRQNTAIQKEIDVLQVKIGSANSIESIEQYATEELGMRYPKANQSIYLTVDRSRNADLVQRIKEKAYRA